MQPSQTGVNLIVVYELKYPPHTRVPLMTPPDLQPQTNLGIPPQTGGPELHLMKFVQNLPHPHYHYHSVKESVVVISTLTSSIIELE